jgi:hypothetical protein
MSSLSKVEVFPLEKIKLSRIKESQKSIPASMIWEGKFTSDLLEVIKDIPLTSSLSINLRLM